MHKLLLASGAQTGYQCETLWDPQGFWKDVPGNNFTPLKYQNQGTIGKVKTWGTINPEQLILCNDSVIVVIMYTRGMVHKLLDYL